MTSDRFTEGIAWLVAGAVIGFLAGVLVAIILSRQTSHIEIVRDESGRIVQIIEMSDIQPITGRRIVNVGTFREKTTP